MKKSLFLLLSALICGCAKKTNVQTPSCRFYNQIKPYAIPYKKNVSKVEANLNDLPIEIYLYNSHSRRGLEIVGEMRISDVLDIMALPRGGKNSLYERCKQRRTFLYLADGNADDSLEENEPALWNAKNIAGLFDCMVKVIMDSSITSIRIKNDEYHELQQGVLKYLRNVKNKPKQKDHYDIYWIESHKGDNKSPLKTSLDIK